MSYELSDSDPSNHNHNTPAIGNHNCGNRSLKESYMGGILHANVSRLFVRFLSISSTPYRGPIILTLLKNALPAEVDQSNLVVAALHRIAFAVKGVAILEVEEANLAALAEGPGALESRKQIAPPSVPPKREIRAMQPHPCGDSNTFRQGPK